MRICFTVAFLCFLLISVGNAQQRHIRSSTELYSQQSTTSKAIGIFARGSKVLILKEGATMSQVETNSKLRGYVLNDFLVEYCNARDEYEPDPMIFRQSEWTYEDFGLHVQVAGLRARTSPSKDGKVLKLLKMNSPHYVDFLPYDQNEWVRAGSYYDDDSQKDIPYYIQRKYLGPILDITQSINAYYGMGEEDGGKQKMAERILEMSFFEGDSLRFVALNLFRNFAISKALVVDMQAIDFEIFALECILNDDNKDPYNEDLALNYYWDQDTLDQGSTKMLIKQQVPVDSSSDFPKELPVCGWGFYKGFYAPGIILIQEEEGSDLGVWRIDFSNEKIKMKINDFWLTKHTKETDFIRAMGSNMSNNLKDGEHQYYIHSWAMIISIKFKDGFPMFWEVLYQC